MSVLVGRVWLLTLATQRMPLLDVHSTTVNTSASRRCRTERYERSVWHCYQPV